MVNSEMSVLGYGARQVWGWFQVLSMRAPNPTYGTVFANVAANRFSVLSIDQMA